MAVDGVGIGVGQSPRRTCFQPGCFRVGVGVTRREGRAGGTRSGQRPCTAHRRRLRPSRSPAVHAPLPCSPLTPVRMLGFLQPGTVPSRGPPGATGTRLSGRGRAVWRPRRERGATASTRDSAGSGAAAPLFHHRRRGPAEQRLPPPAARRPRPFPSPPPHLPAPAGLALPRPPPPPEPRLPCAGLTRTCPGAHRAATATPHTAPRE